MVEHGLIELESTSGVSRSFVAGDILWLAGLPLRALRNPGTIPAVLAAISRRAAEAGSLPVDEGASLT